MSLKEMYRIFVATGLALGLLSLFQNCSKMNFNADNKALVQGAITTLPPSATSAGNQGVCELTCGTQPLIGQHDVCQSQPTEPSSCEETDDGSGSTTTSIVQTVSNSNSTPQTTCMSSAACQLINKNLSEGKLILMRVINNQVSTHKGAVFHAVADPSDCQVTLSDDEIQNELDPET